MHRWRSAAQAVAVFVLLASFFDYFEFDRYDPSAPVNHAVPETAAASAGSARPVEAASTDQGDDQCLWCSPAVLPPPIELRSEQASWLIPAAAPPAPRNQPARFDHPPRM
jgi:hypothetical protein